MKIYYQWRGRRFYDTETGKLYSSYRGHTGILYSYIISYLDSGRKIIYAMAEGQVKIVGF